MDYFDIICKERKSQGKAIILRTKATPTKDDGWDKALEWAKKVDKHNLTKGE